MNATQRNFLASLCLFHVKVTDPPTYNKLKQLAIENRQPAQPRYTLDYVYYAKFKGV